MTDPGLVDQVRQRRPDAIEVLWRRHSSAVLGVARRVTGAPGPAEDTLQEVFLRLWRAPERFDPTRGALRSFLLMEANARAIDWIRRETSRRNAETRDPIHTETVTDLVEAEVWDAAMAQHLRDALDELPDGERDAIELAFYGHHSYREVAIILAVPEGTVKSRIRAGLGRLRDRLVASDLGREQ